MQGAIVAIGFTRWKRPILRDFLGEARIRFVRDARSVPIGSTVAVWGRAAAPKGAGEIWRVEDGFLRSVGLGGELVRPLSWVVDRSGIYYDASAPSDLETLLATRTIDDGLRERARSLRARIVEARLTKYNVGAAHWTRPDGARRVVLVPGQVETDASIAYGAPGIRTNVGLLRAARAAEPDAYLVYKPHPDVVAGLRRPGAGEDGAAAFCDEVVVDAPMHALLDAVDAVHVLTSLAGFEALLRGRHVVTWGQPFYAGWGLTDDREPVARRQRRLGLDELVAATLILYPRYVSRTTRKLISVEQAVLELSQWRAAGVSTAEPWVRLRRAVIGAYNRARGR